MSVERIGVSSVEKIINQMGMIFREQPVDDYGIDAQIEIVENKCATGKLIAVQIKSGNSYFKELTPNSIIYRGKRKHYDYWLNHSLPVIIVLYDPEKDKCYWNIVNKETAILSEQNWKIEISFSNLLEKTYENPEVITDAQRIEHYGQFDHVRIYGHDYISRLESVGFKFERLNISDKYKHYGLIPQEDLFIFTKG